MDISLLDATAQADLVRRKEIKLIELVDAAIERIERLNPVVNAVIAKMYDEARKAALRGRPSHRGRCQRLRRQSERASLRHQHALDHDQEPGSQTMGLTEGRP